MAIPIERLTTSRNGGVSNLVIASTLYGANSLLFAHVLNDSGTPDSISGQDLGTAWIQLGTTQTLGLIHSTLYACHTGASPVAGVITVVDTTTGTSGVTITEATDMGAAAAISTFLKQAVDEDAQYGTGGVVLALPAAVGLTIAFWGGQSNVDMTPNPTLLHDFDYAYIDRQMLTSYNETGDSTPTCTRALNSYTTGHALELVVGVVPPSILNIDTDDSIEAGQPNVVIQTAGLTLPVTAVTFEGEPLTITNGAIENVVVDVPLHINSEWGVVGDLVVTHGGGSETLSNVALEAAPLWTMITLNTLPDTGTTESYFEYSQTDVDVGNFTAVLGDTLIFEDAVGLTVDGRTIPIIDPAATVTGDYKWWDNSLGTFTSVSTYTWTDAGAPVDNIAPVITLDEYVITWPLGVTWVDPNGTVTDNFDATRTIQADVPLDVNSLGTQTLNYNTSDVAGNPATQVQLQVTVISVDVTPDQFVFLDVANAALNTTYINDQDITGVDAGELLTATNGVLSNDNGVTFNSTAVMITGQTVVRAEILAGNSPATEYTQLVTVNGVSATFSVTTATVVTTTFTIDTIRTSVGATLTYTYPIWEIWSAVPEDGVKLDSGANAVITNGVGTIPSSILSAGTEYLLVLRDAGNQPEHYARQWGQFA